MLVSMIHPFRRMRVKSWVWYQGESNSDNYGCYGECTFPKLIESWRQAWTANEFIRKAGEAVLVIGHRGASAAAPENTVVSQEIARRSGTVWIEDDTHPTSDKVPIVIHDDTVDRTTDGKGAVRKLTLAQIKALDAGSWFHPIYKGTRIPTLAEQLSDLHTRGGSLVMEIKGEHSVEECTKLVEAIKAESMMKNVLVHSFDIPSLQRMYTLAPELPLALLRSQLDPDPVAISAKLHLTSYNIEFSAFLKKPSVIADLHRAGVAVMVWTPDSPADWLQLDKAGVDAIITNHPAELQGWVAAWRQKQKSSLLSQAPPPADGGLTPFIFVQLAAYYPDKNLADQRLSQALALKIPNVGMATAIDLGMPSGDSEFLFLFFPPPSLSFLLLFPITKTKQTSSSNKQTRYCNSSCRSHKKSCIWDDKCS